MIKLDASLIRLSPSRMVARRFGTLRFAITDVAATASGGEMMPPRRKPSASVNPGMSQTEKYATTVEVNMTSPNASNRIARFHFQKSFHDVCQAALYNNGGRKIKNTTSGFISSTGMPGIIQITI